MTKQAHRWMLVLFVLVAATSMTWLAFDATSQGGSGRVIRVGLYQNPPKIYADREGRPAGLFADLLSDIARDEHWRLSYVRCAWAECLQLLRHGQIDLMPDVAYSAARARDFDFHAIPVAYGWSQVFVKPQLSVHTLADLDGKRIAVLRSGIQQVYFNRLMRSEGLTYTPVLIDTFAAGFEAVEDGRADAVVSNNFFSARNGRRQYGLHETPIVFQPVSLYFATARGHHDDLLSAIDMHLAAWRETPDSPYFTALRHAMAPVPVEIVPSWVRISLYVVGGFSLLFLVVSLTLRWQVRQRTAERDRTSSQLEQMLRASPVVLYRLREEDDRFVPEWISPNIERLFGYPMSDVYKADWWRQHLHPDDAPAAAARMDSLPEVGTVTHEYRFIDAEGRTRFIRDEMSITPPMGDRPRSIVGTWNDLTESRQQAERVDFLTRHDSLTHLPNRLQLTQRLAHSIDRARQDAAQLAILWIDLDRFKYINDTMGHSVGDAFLRTSAEAMRSALGPSDALARVGGDEFVVVIEQGASAHHASSVARRILSIFASPVVIGEHELIVTASIGISLFPDNGEDTDTLLRHAELALYEAKNQGRNRWCFFDYRLSAGVLERLVMESSLRGAIERDELLLHYQPQIELATGRPVGVEALVRWQHPRIGLLPPAQFIGLAEETGIVSDIGLWVLRESCRQMVEWKRAGVDVPRISVNLSVQQVEHVELRAQIADILHRCELEPSRLELELTESTIMREPERATRMLTGLKSLGVKLSIDDFGTGHSSLSYLKRLPLDRLKIDQSFVRDIGRDPDDEAISRAVIELARRLGLETVAEGVEREEQAEFLRREGCDVAQGYLYCKPLPADELSAYWRAGSAARSISSASTTAGQ